MAHYTGPRRRQFETLEPRQMMAGDVLVNAVDGVLNIEGDVEANKVLITSGAEAGAFIVTGLDGTTLGGGTEPVTVTGVRSIRVDLGEGDDLVAIAGASVRGRVKIETGEGADRVLIGTGEGATELAGVLPADLSVNIRGNLSIETDGGADQVLVDDAVASHIDVNAGDGEDVVTLGSTAPVEESGARVESRGVHVRLGDGNDTLQADQVAGRKGVFVSGGDGDNVINANLVSGATLVVLGGDGVDNVTVADADVRALGIHTGDGNDSVNVRDSVFAALGVSLGDGDDLLTTANLEAKVALLSGGDGEDTLDQAVASLFEHSRIAGFEIPADVNADNLPRRHGFLGRALRRLRR